MRNVVIVMCVLLSSICAKAAFTEDWNSGIDPLKWSVLGSSSVINLEDLGGGDYALALRGYQDVGAPAPVWGDAIYSRAGFNRADGASIQFKVWYKSGVNVQAGMHGGWHYSTSGPQYATIEAAVDYVFSDFRATEAVNVNGIQSGPSMSFLNSHWGSANTKNAALDVRISLDPVKGAIFEIYDKVNAVWVVDRDSTGLAYGGTAAAAYIGFGPFHGQAGTTLIDDITVIPEPATLSLVGLGILGLLRRKKD